MSAQTARVQSKHVSTKVPVNTEKEQLSQQLQSSIARRAYQLYEESGGKHGDDFIHWLQAESELLTRVDGIQESASWFTINVPLKGFNCNDVQIAVEPTHAIIAAESQQQPPTGNPPGASTSSESQRAVFMYVKWPSEVDPITASAYLQNETLNLTAKRASPVAENDRTRSATSND
jgi:HSP20 family molecular chaperone IbpA